MTFNLKGNDISRWIQTKHGFQWLWIQKIEQTDVRRLILKKIFEVTLICTCTIEFQMAYISKIKQKKVEHVLFLDHLINRNLHYYGINRLKHYYSVMPGASFKAERIFRNRKKKQLDMPVKIDIVFSFWVSFRIEFAYVAVETSVVVGINLYLYICECNHYWHITDAPFDFILFDISLPLFRFCSSFN